MSGVRDQKLVHVGFHPEDLRRLDEWASKRGIPRNRAIVALLDIVTGVTETKEQRLARARGLVAGVATDAANGVANPVDTGVATDVESRVVDYDY